jgi:hypothetical protein
MTKKKASRAAKPAASRKPAATAPSGGKGIKVRATQTGYYGDKLQRPGDVFVIENERAFSKKWMERVDARTPEHTSKTSPELAERKPAQSEGASDDDVLGDK